MKIAGSTKLISSLIVGLFIFACSKEYKPHATMYFVCKGLENRHTRLSNLPPGVGDINESYEVIDSYSISEVPTVGAPKGWYDWYVRRVDKNGLTSGFTGQSYFPPAEDPTKLPARDNVVTVDDQLVTISTYKPRFGTESINRISGAWARSSQYEEKSGGNSISVWLSVLNGKCESVKLKSE